MLCLVIILTSCGKKDPARTEGIPEVKTEMTTEVKTDQTKAPETIGSGETEVSARTEQETEIESTELKAPSGEVIPMFAERYPAAFMINNQTEARPQSGLSKAKLIYQMLTEGRTTRLLLLTDAQEGVVGPIRSARPAYLDLVAQEQAFYVHAGNYRVIAASPVKNDIKTLDALKGYFHMYYRTKHRKSPHNFYTTLENVYRNAKKAYGSVIPAEPVRGLYLQKEFVLPGGGEDVKSVSYNFSSLKEKFQYDAQTKSYKKYNNGQALVDEQTKKDLEVANIIVLHRPHGLMPNGIHNKVDWIGQGDATYLTGGKKYAITWSKDDHTSPLLYFIEGEELVLNPGLTWVIVVDDKALKTVSYD